MPTRSPQSQFHAYQPPLTPFQQFLALLFAPVRATAALIQHTEIRGTTWTTRNRTLIYRIGFVCIVLGIVWSFSGGNKREDEGLEWMDLPTREEGTGLGGMSGNAGRGIPVPSVSLELIKDSSTVRAPGTTTNEGGLPPCGCSKDTDDGEWVLRSDSLESSQQFVRSNPLLRTFDDFNTSLWDSNCTREMKALYKVWKPRKCLLLDPYFGADSKLNQDIDKIEFDLASLQNSDFPKNRIPKKATDLGAKMSAALASDPALSTIYRNKRIALIGDSLMLQWLDGIRKFFPLASPHFNSPHDKKPDPDLRVSRWIDPPLPWGFNVTFDMMRLNQPGPEFPGIMEYVFDSRKYDVIIVNFGIWYNRDAKPDNVTVRAIRQGNLTGFTPLTLEHYKEDMARFGKAYGKLKNERQAEGRWPVVIWGESTPQHFKDGSFTWDEFREPDENAEENKGKPKSECFPYASLESFTEKGNWRNSIAEPIVDTNQIPALRWSKALHYLHDNHPFRYYPKRKAWGNDCTHFCEPSVKTVHGLQVLTGCLREQVERADG